MPLSDLTRNRDNTANSLITPSAQPCGARTVSVSELGALQRSLCPRSLCDRTRRSVLACVSGPGCPRSCRRLCHCFCEASAVSMSGPGALGPALCVGPGTLCVGPGALCQGSLRGPAAPCVGAQCSLSRVGVGPRGPFSKNRFVTSRRSMCRAPALSGSQSGPGSPLPTLFVSGPASVWAFRGSFGGLSVSGPALCVGVRVTGTGALCVGARCSVSGRGAHCVGSLCRGLVLSVMCRPPIRPRKPRAPSAHPRATHPAPRAPKLRSACHPSSPARSFFQERIPNLTAWGEKHVFLYQNVPKHGNNASIICTG